jgi:hypothetical protein
MKVRLQELLTYPCSFTTSWTNVYNSQHSFIDRQWDEPIVLTFNGQNNTAILNVDKDNQNAKVIINHLYDHRHQQQQLTNFNPMARAPNNPIL